MDEKYLENLFNSFGGADRFGAYGDFKDLMMNNGDYRSQFYKQIGQQTLGDYTDFEDLVKKKDGGTEPVGTGDSLSRSQKTSGSSLDAFQSVPGMVAAGMAPPTYLLNKRQLGDFARAGGLVASPEAAHQLADDILAKPVSREERERDRLIDVVDESFGRIRKDETRKLQRIVEGAASQGADIEVQQADIPGQVDELLQERGYNNAVGFVDQALARNDYKSLRDVINNSYGAEVTNTYEDKEKSNLRQEQQRFNVLLDRMSSRQYALTNPQVIDDYQYDVVGRKPISKEITPNQYTGLRYLQANNPQMYEQFSMELAKAADPDLFTPKLQDRIGRYFYGAKPYDKNNRDYQYMLYNLDKKGAEINGMAIGDQMRNIAPEKERIDQEFRGRLSGLSTQMMNATDYTTRTNLQDAINQVRDEYDTNPTVIEFGALQQLANQNEVDFREKYPDQSSRARENMVRDILQNDGTNVMGAVGRRVKWLFNNTITGIANITGGNEFEFGQSRNYLRNLRRAAEESAEQYQPTYNAAVQPLYKLNFSPADYAYIKNVRDSEMDDQEQEKLIGDYLEKNEDRIRYEENPEAGKRNWTWGAIGNQVADVGTQVLYQGGLMMLTGGLGRTASSATAAARTAGAADVAATIPAAAAFDVGAEGIAAAAMRTTFGAGLKEKVAHLGSIMGSSFVTAYQPAYAEALQQGKSVEEAETYANQIAIVNALSETISPDALILKRAASGVKGLSELVTPEAMTTARRLRTNAGYFMKGYAQNVGNETLEEVTAAFGEYGIDQLHNMNKDEFNTLGERVKNAAITTAIGMTPFGISAGGSTVRNSSRMQKEMFYQAGLYPDMVKQEINTLADDGGISQAEANKRISMVNTMERIVHQLPPMDNGRPMPDRAKQEYAFNRFQQAVLEDDLKKVDDNNSREFLAVQVGEYIEKNKRLLRGLGQSAAPAETFAATQTVPEAVPAEQAVVAEEPTAPVEVATPAQYQVGQVLDSPQVGNVEIVGRSGDVFSVRTPDGNVEDYTAAEIDEYIKPIGVTISRQAPAEITPEIAGATPSIYVQMPSAQPEISSPINTPSNATDQIIEQQGADEQSAQGDQSGEAPQTSGGNSLQQPAPNEEEGQVVTAQPGAEPVAPFIEAGVESGPAPAVATLEIEQPVEEAEVPLPDLIDERMGLSASQEASIDKMPIARLYSNIMELDPESPVKERANEYNKRELQGILKGLVARERIAGPRAETLATAPAPSPLMNATKAYTSARQLQERRTNDLRQVTNKNSQDYKVKKAFLDQATSNMRKAESEYLRALKDENKGLRERRRDSLGIAAGRTDAEIITNYIEMAKVYVRQGARSLEEFATKLGEKINPYMQRGWDIVHSKDAPLQLQGETTKTYLKRLRTWEKEQTTAPETTERQRRRASNQSEELQLGVKKLGEGIEVLRKDINTSRQSFNQQLGLEADDYTTFVAALKWNIDNNTIKKRTASAVLKNIRNTDTRNVVATEMQLLKLQLAERERGSKLGYKAAVKDLRGIREQVSSLLRDLSENDLFKNGNFTERDMLSLARQVNRIYNQEGLDNFARFIDQLLGNADLAAVITDIGELQDKIGNILRKKDAITANMIRKNQLIGNRGVLRGLKNINALQAEDPSRLRDMLQNVVDSLQGTEVLTTSNQDIMDYLEADTQRQVNEKAANLKSRYREALDYIGAELGAASLTGTRTAAEFDNLVDSIVNDPYRSEEQKIKELNILRTAVLAQENQVEHGGSMDNIDEVYDQVREGGSGRTTTRLHERLTPVIEAGQDFLQVALDASDFNATEQQREWVRSIIAIDPARLSTKQLVLLKNVIDNILLNQDFAGSQAFHIWQNAQKKVGTFLKWGADKGKNLRKDTFEGALGNAFKSLSSSDQIIRTIAENDYDMATRLMDVTGLGDIKAKHAQAKQLIDRELTEPLKKIYRKYDGLRTPESIIKRGMYAYLNENNFGSPQDQQEEFARRKMIMEQDIERKKTSDDPAMKKEVVLTEQVYQDNFSSINNQAQLQSAAILNQGETEVYNLFRDFYDRHKEDFRNVVESMLNLPFNDVNNYVKDSYKILEGATADADFTGMGNSAFLNAKDPNSPSTATLARNRFSNLDNIAMLDDQGRVANYRVINYAFDTQQLHNASAMMEDIYTLEPRLEAEAALNSEALKQYMGGTNLRTMRDNVENQVRSQQRLLERKGGEFIGQSAEKLANTLNKIGIRQVLFSLSQFAKQPADIIVNTASNLGGDFPMFFQALADFPILLGTDAKPYITDLLSQSEIALRGKTYGGSNWLSQQALSEIKQEVKGMAKDAELENPDKLSFLIEAPDTYFAKIGWLAYYAQSLKRQGLVEGYNDIDWESESKNINREARDYAQLMSSTRLNVNSKESQSEFYAKTAGLGRLLQITFLPLSSFNMNNYALMYGDVRTLSGPGTNKQKLTALRSISSRMLAELAFQTVRAYLAMSIKAGAASLLSLFGLEPPDKKDDDTWWRITSESIKNMFFGLLGNISSEAAANFINFLGQKTVDKKLLKTYDENPNIPSNNFGMFSLFGNSYENMSNYVERIVNPVDNHGNPIDVSDSEKAILAFSIIANIAGSLGYMEGDTKRIIDAAAAKVARDISKEAKDPYWALFNDPNKKPNITINGKKVEWNDAQLEYYNAQRQYYLEQNKEKNWTDEYKSREATDRAKTDLQKKYKGEIKYKKDE